MIKKNRILVFLGVILAIAFVSGVSIMAATNYGSSSDPLVTLSYLTNKLSPEILDDMDSMISSAESDFSASLNNQINTFKTAIDSKLSGSTVTATTDTFSVVTLSKGQTVTCAVGAEIMLRIGTASGSGSSSPSLIDITSGSSLSSGSALTTNHMYMVTIAGNGVKATSSTVKILIRGNYTVG